MNPQPSAPFAAIACARCHNIWAVSTRHASATCPACASPTTLADRAPLWQGASAAEAQAAVGQLRAGAQGAASMQALERSKSLPRHDSPLDAAAARAKGIANKSSRAEMVALALTRLVGQAPHGDLIEAMQRAGLERSRAESEVVRMLAMDLLMEPKAGHFRVLDA